MTGLIDRRLVLLLVAVTAFAAGLGTDTRAVPPPDLLILALGVGFVAGIFIGVVVGIAIATFVLLHRSPTSREVEGDNHG